MILKTGVSFMKKLLSVLLAIVMLILIVPIGTVIVGAEIVENPLDFLEYEIENDEVTIVDCDDSINGALAVPNQIEGYPVTKIGGSAFSDCDNLSAVSVPNTVIIVENYAFHGCDSLEYVVIGNGVTVLGENAFSHCTKLKNIQLGNKVERIEGYCFNNCYELQDIVIPDSVEFIGTWAFVSCNKLQTITIGKGLKEVDEWAFYGCNNIESVYITDLVSWCNIDFDRNFGSPLRYAGNLYLNGKLIEDLVITEEIENISHIDASTVKNIYISDIAVWFNVIKNSNIIFENVNYIVSGCENGYIEISEGITSIPSYAFYGAQNIYGVEIPTSLTEVEEFAFYNSDTFAEVYYAGDESARENITIYDNQFVNASWKYNTCGEDSHYFHHCCVTECDYCGWKREAPHNYLYENCGTTCNICGYVREVTEEKHSFENNCDAYCDECGYFRQPQDHVYDDNCDSYCNECDEYRTATHYFQNFESDNNATCTENGTKTARCERCEATSTVILGDTALGHEFINYIYDEGSAKCNKDGTKTAKCERCDVTDTMIAEGTALEHKFELKFDDEQHWYECFCGEEKAESRYSHGYSRETNAEYHWLVCFCGHIIEKEEHDWKDATCTEPKICKVCYDIKGTEKGHSHIASVDTPATCGKEGVMKYKCGCGDEFTKSIAKTKNHKNINVLTQATLIKNGSIVNKCSVCGTVAKTTAIAKIASVTTTSKVTYNGKTKTPAVTVKDANGKVIASSNYTVSYAKGRKNYGKYKITVTFNGNYSGSKAIYFEIVPKGTKVSKITAARKSLKVKIKRKKSVSGYQIQYSLKKNSLTSKTIKKLKAKKTYYVRVRTYKTVNGKKYYSAWSKVSKKKTK